MVYGFNHKYKVDVVEFFTSHSLRVLVCILL